MVLIFEKVDYSLPNCILMKNLQSDKKFYFLILKSDNELTDQDQ